MISKNDIDALAKSIEVHRVLYDLGFIYTDEPHNPRLSTELKKLTKRLMRGDITDFNHNILSKLTDDV